MTEDRKRTVRLADLTPDQRQAVLALIAARKSATERLIEPNSVPPPRSGARRTGRSAWS